MVKKTGKKTVKKAAKQKKGVKYTCDSCGMVVAVEKGCECDPCDIVCCDQDMRVLECC